MIKRDKRDMMARLAQTVAEDAAAPEPEAEEIKTEKQKDVKTAPGARTQKGSAPAAAGTARRRSTGALKQMTIKLEPDVRSRLLQESLRRKAQDSEDWPIQQIVTEAVNAYLGGK
jgi:hypothetical protein